MKSASNAIFWCVSKLQFISAEYILWQHHASDGEFEIAMFSVEFEGTSGSRYSEQRQQPDLIWSNCERLDCFHGILFHSNRNICDWESVQALRLICSHSC